MLSSRAALISTTVFIAAAASSAAQVAFPIITGAGGSTVSSMSSWRRSVVSSPGGTLWALVRDADSSGGGQLHLRASTDGGTTWAGRFDVPTTGDGSGAIVFGRGCSALHVAWHALDGGSYANVYHQVFDTQTGSFVGRPRQLTQATGPNDQYYASDVAASCRGALVIAITTHRAPPTSVWSSGWSAGILVRRPGAVAFDPVRQVNTDAYGQRIDLQAVGEVVHMAFRTNTGGYGTRYRAFDLEAMQFTTNGDVQVDTATSNVSQIAADGHGNLYVLYVRGGSSPGSGELRVAHGTAAAPTQWTSSLVAADPDLLKGNVSDYHYSLASARDQVVVFYAKKTNDSYSTLYFRVLVAGQFATPETVAIQSNDVDRFRSVGGVRNPNDELSPSCVVENRSAAFPDRRVEFVRLGSAARATRFGIACRGARSSWPSLFARSTSSAGGNVDLAWSRGPAGAPGVLFADPVCLAQPFDLSSVGMPGCALAIGTTVSGAMALDSAGSLALRLTIPPNAPYVGVPVHFQSALLAPGANQLGAILTNAATVIVQ